VAGAVGLLLTAGSALALQMLPKGGQVNDDLASGINKALSVNGEDPANADVVGGALVAGKPAVPWAIFRQQETNGAPPPHDQVFSRSFAAGAWTTRGQGTVGGLSSASPTFKGSLNFSQVQDGEAPAIDFAGAGRTVPWASWYEHTIGTGFNHNNVFASRFDNSGDTNQNKWIFAGQNRGTGSGAVQIPSLNIRTNQDAENPSVAGGSAVDPTKPGPWITWQETTTSPVNAKDQIFVERPIGPASANCDGVKPAGVPVAGHVPAIGGFCWQQTGNPRVGPQGADPSLNVDPTRSGIEPDIAFTGASDSVPWVVWYETGPTTLSGLHTNELVFAAKAVSDGLAAHGGFQWVAVGNARTATLGTTGTHGFGTCAVSGAGEAQCSLNANPANDAEDPRVAAGTMNPANPTVPWIAWDENVAGVKRIFVSRLVGSGSAARFQIVNNGAPVSSASGDATRPDITFSGNTPYVSWRQNVGGVAKGFLSHFVNPASPTIVHDTAALPLTPTAQADVREPISSACTANPFNSDGAACQGPAVGTPFVLFTNGTSPRGLFADAYSPNAVTTGAASSITSSSARVTGSANPLGASVNLSIEFGTTTAYGSTLSPNKTGPDNHADAISAVLSGLPAGTTIHYRAFAVSDFGKFVGADRTFTTTAASHEARILR
jgi:hypothetical protein